MNDEIKEILEESIYCNYDLHTGEKKKLLDYITNLQEENEKLLKIKKYGEDVGNKRNELYDRIDKAIEFINDNAVYKKITINQQVYYNEYIVNQALNILRGDKE